MLKFDEVYKSVFILKVAMEQTMFRAFIQEYPLPEGTNPTHIKALAALSIRGKCPMSEIAHFLNLEKGSFTPVANKLIALGYIVKERSQEDKRVYNISLSEEGMAIADKFLEGHADYVRGLLESLSPEQQEEFYNSLEMVTSTLFKITEQSEDSFNPYKGPTFVRP